MRIPLGVGHGLGELPVIHELADAFFPGLGGHGDGHLRRDGPDVLHGGQHEAQGLLFGGDEGADGAAMRAALESFDKV